MNDTLTNPHDKFFKESFTYKQTARDFLYYYLPTELSQLFDLDTLEISKDSFIDADLQEHFSDVLYQITLHTGQALQIYILFEHKSYPDKWIALQLYGYMGRIWQQQDKQAHKSLLPILPLVIYHGPTAWTINQEFLGLFSAELPPALKPYLPNFRYWLLDLSGYPDEQIKGWAILQACFRLLKYVQSQEFGPQFEQSIRLLLELPQQETALQYVETMLRYAVNAAKESSREALKTIVIEMLEKGDELMMTIAEKWIEEGVQIGFERGQNKGIEIGVEVGAQQEALNLLLRTLPRLFGELPAPLVEQLKQLKLPHLRQAVDMAFEVKTIAEFETMVAHWLTPQA